MRIPRRRCLALVSSTVTVGIAGCTNAPGTETASPTRTVELTITVSGPDGERPFFTGDDIASVGSVQNSERMGYAVPVELTDSGTEQAVEAFTDVGAGENPDESSITYSVQGDVEVEETFAISRALADAIEAGEWDGQLSLQFEERDTAETVRDALQRRS